MEGRSYFADIDPDANAPILEKKISQRSLKARLTAAVKEPDRVFGED